MLRPLGALRLVVLPVSASGAHRHGWATKRGRGYLYDIKLQARPARRPGSHLAYDYNVYYAEEYGTDSSPFGG